MGESRPISRREFLGAGLAAAALAACARRPPLTGSLLGPSRERGHLLRSGRFPVAAREEKVPVVIVGGGAAGLSAAWELRRAGFDDFELLELEDRAGGNAAWGRNEVSAYPWGAHYLPVPGPHATELKVLLRELGVLTGADRWDERFLCHAPEERLFIHGRWQDGLFPSDAMSAEDRRQKERWDARVRALRAGRGKDGKPLFAIPMERSSSELAALDGLSMKAWLDREGFTSERLLWYLDYATRDDYGGTLDEVSAWAGLHYFAARAEGDDDRVLTWPEGNGWLVERLLERAGDRVRGGSVVMRVAPDGAGAVVDALDAASGAPRRLRARQVIVATPRFVAARLVPGVSAEGFEYAPWLTCNLTLEPPRDGRGAPPSWDNVLYKGEGLGYVDARHQDLSLDRRRTVWTYYRPLTGGPDARRREAFGWDWEKCRDLCLDDLSRAHPDLRERTTRLDAWLWGHGMVLPRPGFLFGARRRAALAPRGAVHFAHSDQSGLSLFEEAHYRGVMAARAVLSVLS
ncbi:MAG: FAD-dependent oxidoreductase [Elusimicrobiota bacterium]|nr:FAD-dependent oxidoreductase [Elusimicrobiota bacterium]